MHPAKQVCALTAVATLHIMLLWAAAASLNHQGPVSPPCDSQPTTAAAAAAAAAAFG
jgi:hypothetical protein